MWISEIKLITDPLHFVDSFINDAAIFIVFLIVFFTVKYSRLTASLEQYFLTFLAHNFYNWSLEV